MLINHTIGMCGGYMPEHFLSPPSPTTERPSPPSPTASDPSDSPPLQTGVYFNLDVASDSGQLWVTLQDPDTVRI